MTLADLVNAGATQQTQAMANSGASLSDIFHGFANPDAVLSAPVSQAAFMGSTTQLKALQDAARRIATGVEGLTGDAKYAALQQNAAAQRALQGAPDMAAGASTIPPDVSLMRAIMERVMDASNRPFDFK